MDLVKFLRYIPPEFGVGTVLLVSLLFLLVLLALYASWSLFADRSSDKCFCGEEQRLKC